ncbi:MAG: hypothetical protein ACREIT_05310 [Tepidisphaeraceae bacterium]
MITLLLPGCTPPKPVPEASGNIASRDGKRTGTHQVIATPGGPRVLGLDLNDPVQPIASDQPIALGAAKNEWASFVIQVSDLAPGPKANTIHTLRIQPPQLITANASISAEHFTVAQVLPMPIDANRAGYVRHTGLSGALSRLPRALLPMKINDGRVNLQTLRDPNRPGSPDSYTPAPGSAPAMLWIDLHIPPQTPPGEYETACEILAGGVERPVAAVPVKITVYDFVIPDERHLMMVGQLQWDVLARHFTDRFEAVTPRLLNRTDARYAPAIKTLDQLVTLAQAHRADLVVPRLQPTVKWPAGKPPQVDWRDFDSVVGPWLRGDAFANKVPLGYWPLPAVDFLDRFDQLSQLEYWSDASTHFDQLEWLGRSAVFIDKPTPGRVSTSESIALSAEAAQTLDVHPRLRVTAPLEDDQVQFASSGNPRLIDPLKASRLLTAAPNLVFSTPMQRWPQDLAKPQRWLRTDLPGLLPYAGAGGDERDVRVWSWLAFLRQAQFILWDTVLPRHADSNKPADPNELVWFYPGHWFGVDEPVPSVQLKWLRRAQQDYEYLRLAWERGEKINALLMARLIAKPVEIQPNQSPDPTYSLMSGTTDARAWSDAQALLARTILLREPGQAREPEKEHALNLQTLQWIEPQERPLLLGQATQWLLDPVRNVNAGENWINLRLGIDIYNASDTTPDQNTLQWSALPPGWQVKPQPVTISALQQYHVDRFGIEGRFNLDRLTEQASRQPVEVTFVNGFTKKQSKLRVVLPIAASDRREGRLAIDGSLGEWTAADAIQDGPMVRMIDRPALQSQHVRTASSASSVYTGWADENFYLAFKVTGAKPVDAGSGRNFIDYQSRRAWGEDLIQLVVQPVQADNTLGPVLHIAINPNGRAWVERKLDPRLHANPWQPLNGADVRFASTIEGPDWRGELAIPWRAITAASADAAPARPTLLRFNFVQHQTTTGESASWAGPVDFGRDDSFTGLIYVREPENPGMAGPFESR